MTDKVTCALAWFVPIIVGWAAIYVLVAILVRSFT